jgi:large subunit ribosomal protein L15
VDAGTLATDGVIDHAVLKAAGVARGGKDGVRVLAKGSFSSKLSFKVAGVSKSAREAIEAAGGSVEVIELVAAADKHKAKHRTVQTARAADKAEKKAAAKA